MEFVFEEVVVIASLRAPVIFHNLTIHPAGVWPVNWLYIYEGPAKCFVTGFGLLQCYVLSNIFLLQTFKVFPLY